MEYGGGFKGHPTYTLVVHAPWCHRKTRREKRSSRGCVNVARNCKEVSFRGSVGLGLRTLQKSLQLFKR